MAITFVQIFIPIALFGLLILGLFRSLRALRNPEINTRCALGLLMVLTGILVAHLGHLTDRHASPSSMMWVDLSPWLAIGMLLIGTFMAIRGLVEVRKHKIAGRKYAYGALSCMAVFSGLVGVAIVSLPDSTYSRSSNSGRDYVAVEPPQWKTVPAFNFKIDALSSDWSPLNASRFNPDVKVAFVRNSPQAAFSVIPEVRPENPGEQITSNELAEAAIEMLRERSTKVHCTERVRHSIHDMEGVTFGCDSWQGTRRLRHRYWVMSTNGFCYQLIVSGPTNDRDRKTFDRMAWEAIQSFDLISRKPPVRSELQHELVSKANSYRVKVQGSGCRPWAAVSEEVRGAEHGLLSRSTALAVTPVRLLAGTVSTRVLDEALLATLDFDLSAGASWRPVKVSGLTAREYRRQRSYDSGESFDYRVRVARRDNMAWMIAAWTEKSADSEARLAQMFSTVSLDLDSTDAPLEVVGAEEGRRLSQVYGEIATAQLRAGETEAALRHMDRATEWAPNNLDSHYLRLQILCRLERYSDVVTTASEVLGRFPGDVMTRSFRAFGRAQTGANQLAAEEFAELFTAGYREDAELRICADLLWKLDRRDEAHQVIETYLAHGTSIAARILRADLVARGGEADRALQQLDEARRERPPNWELESAYWSHLTDLERHREALEICNRALGEGLEFELVYECKASTQLSLGEREHARQTVSAGLEEFPSSVMLRNLSEQIDGAMGLGAKRFADQRIAAVALPETFDRVAASPDRADDPASGFAEADAWYSRRVDAHEFRIGEAIRTTHYRALKVVTPEGVTSLNTFPFGFDPLAERMFVNQLVVRAPDGSETHRGVPDNYYVQDAEEGAIASQRKVLHIPVPGLEPGGTIELTVTRRDLAVADEFLFREHILSSAYPIRTAGVIIRGDVDRLQYQATAGVTVQKSAELLEFTCTNTRPMISEAYQPTFQEFCPTVALGDRAASWSSEGASYFERLSERLPVEDAVAKAAAEAIVGLVSVDARTRALVALVRDRLTYKALEFGTRGRMPDPASKVLAQRYGDCKDHSLLLHQLLTAAEIPSYLALVNTGAPVRRDLPSLDQFNHMVVFCPQSMGGGFFDGTDEYLRPDIAVPVGLAGAQALVLDGEQSRLLEVGDYRPAHSRIECDRRVDLSEQDRAAVTEKLTLHGYYAGWMRGYLRSVDKRRRSELVREMVDSFAEGASITKHEIRGLEDSARPLEVDLRYSVPCAMHRVGNVVVGRLPAGWAHYYLRVKLGPQRHSPLLLRYPLSIRTRTRAIAADGLQFRPLADTWQRSGESHFGQFELQTSTRDQAIVIHFSAERKATAAPADRFDEFKGFSRRASEALFGDLEMGQTR